MNIKIINKNIPILYNKNSIGNSTKDKSYAEHPFFVDTVQIDKNENICPVENINMQFINCEHETNYNFGITSYEAINDYDFLYKIYELEIYEDVDKFINDQLDKLPIQSKKRFCNAVYNAYKDDINFPNSKLIEVIQEVLEKLYNKDLSTKKILKIINKSKNSKNKMPCELYDIFS